MATVFRSVPIPITCPFCHNLVVTRTRSFVTQKTHSIALLLCFLCLFPLAACVYCCNCVRDVAHYCPECNSLLGVHERFNNSHVMATYDYKYYDIEKPKKGTAGEGETGEGMENMEVKEADEILYEKTSPLEYWYMKYKKTDDKLIESSDIKPKRTASTFNKFKNEALGSNLRDYLNDLNKSANEKLAGSMPEDNNMGKSTEKEPNLPAEKVSIPHLLRQKYTQTEVQEDIEGSTDSNMESEPSDLDASDESGVDLSTTVFENKQEADNEEDIDNSDNDSIFFKDVGTQTGHLGRIKIRKSFENIPKAVTPKDMSTEKMSTPYNSATSLDESVAKQLSSTDNLKKDEKQAEDSAEDKTTGNEMSSARSSYFSTMSGSAIMHDARSDDSLTSNDKEKKESKKSK